MIAISSFIEASFNGAMMELGPSRVIKDDKTLHRNQYAWNKGEFLRPSVAS